MIIKIAATMLMMCAQTILINDTTFEFNDHDKKMYERNSQRCGKDYYSDTPCVKYFKKVGERDYHLVCSTKTVRKSNE